MTSPILEVEDVETKKAARAAAAAGDTGEPSAKKSKQGPNEPPAGGFNKDAYQRMLVNSTYAGLEDVLILKTKSKKPPSVLYANDEVSSLLSALDKDPTFEANFLSLYTAKVRYSMLQIYHFEFFFLVY